MARTGRSGCWYMKPRNAEPRLHRMLPGCRTASRHEQGPAVASILRESPRRFARQLPEPVVVRDRQCPLQHRPQQPGKKTMLRLFGDHPGAVAVRLQKPTVVAAGAPTPPDPADPVWGGGVPPLWWGARAPTL